MIQSIQRRTLRIGIGVLLAIAAVAVVLQLLGILSMFVELLTVAYVSSALRLTAPIAFAALGGIFAEKAGVINIGLEGLMIISAFASISATHTFAGSGIGPATSRWLGFSVAVLASVFVALIFAIVCIRYRANQIIAGLAVWLLGLGLAPFISRVIYDTVNAPSVSTFTTWGIPLLQDIPVLGPVLFDAGPMVYLMLITVPLAWYVLNRTPYGRWVEAAGENPMALDTAGINVHRIRYSGVIISGLLSGIGGAALALSSVGTFVGVGETSVGGRGFIGLTAYLFGNYNPFGAFGASLLFGSLDALEFRIQNLPLDLPSYAPEIVQLFPYIAIIVVLSLIGRTQMPAKVGEHYGSGEE